MKKTTIAATITILLIIAAFTYQSRITSKKISIPTNLNESNFLQQLTPGKTAKGFFGIPWGTNSQDVEGLSYDDPFTNALPNDNIYKKLYSYNHPSLQLNLAENPLNNPRFLFHPKYGLSIGMIDVLYPTIRYRDYLTSVKNIEIFLRSQYGSPISEAESWISLKTLNKKVPSYFIEWQDRDVAVYFTYMKPSITSPSYIYFIYVCPIKQAEEATSDLYLE